MHYCIEWRLRLFFCILGRQQINLLEDALFGGSVSQIVYITYPGSDLLDNFTTSSEDLFDLGT